MYTLRRDTCLFIYFVSAVCRPAPLQQINRHIQARLDFSTASPERRLLFVTSVQWGACFVDRHHSGALALWTTTGEGLLFCGKVMLRCACA